jgi:hypothetical protein
MTYNLMKPLASFRNICLQRDFKLYSLARGGSDPCSIGGMGCTSISPAKTSHATPGVFHWAVVGKCSGGCKAPRGTSFSVPWGDGGSFTYLRRKGKQCDSTRATSLQASTIGSRVASTKATIDQMKLRTTHHVKYPCKRGTTSKFPVFLTFPIEGPSPNLSVRLQGLCALISAGNGEHFLSEG